MRRRLAAILSGIFCAAAFFGLSRTSIGTQIVFIGQWDLSAPGELYFWLGFVFLIFPSGFLVGYGLAPWVEQPLFKAWSRINRLDKTEKAVGIVFLATIVGVVSFLAHRLMLLGFPVTDDELSIRLGGQILANATAMVPIPPGFEAYPRFFLYIRDGMYTSVDWLGGQLAWAFSELTRTGSGIFHLAAIVPCCLIAILMSQRISTAWGLVGAVMVFTSPMAFMLSATTHAHLLSRAFISIGVFCYYRAVSRSTLYNWMLLGLALGLGSLCRPAETLALSAPLLLFPMVSLFRREHGAAKAIAGIALGCVIPVLFFLLHNHLVTGNALMPARFGPQEQKLYCIVNKLELNLPFLEKLLSRFCSNVSYNFLMLSIWFWGPVGVVLAILGVFTDRFTKLLGVGVVLDLVLGLLHGDYGIHAVGPIHYSEAVVPLSILSVHGVRNLTKYLANHTIRPHLAGVLLATYATLSLGIFNFWHGKALYEQAKIHQTIYGMLEAGAFDNSVVLAPPYYHVWRFKPEFWKTRSWVLEWREPHPFEKDRVVILYDVKEAATAIKGRYSKRKVYRMEVLENEPYWKFSPIAFRNTK